MGYRVVMMEGAEEDLDKFVVTEAPAQTFGW